MIDQIFLSIKSIKLLPLFLCYMVDKVIWWLWNLVWTYFQAPWRTKDFFLILMKKNWNANKSTAKEKWHSNSSIQIFYILPHISKQNRNWFYLHNLIQTLNGNPFSAFAIDSEFPELAGRMELKIDFSARWEESNLWLALFFGKFVGVKGRCAQNRSLKFGLRS